MKWDNRQKVAELIREREIYKSILLQTELGHAILMVGNTALPPCSNDDSRALTAIASRSARESLITIDASLKNLGIEIED